MYQSRNASQYPQRRGGFSLFPESSPQGVSGLGNIFEDTTTSGYFNVDGLDTIPLFGNPNPNSFLANSAGVPHYIPAATTGFSFSDIPTSALIAVLGTGLLLAAFARH